jgi:hypothetical protein
VARGVATGGGVESEREGGGGGGGGDGSGGGGGGGGAGGREWIPYVGASVIGLGLTNQQTSVLLSVPLACGVLLAGRQALLRAGALLTLVGCGLIGLTPYLYLVVAGEQATNTYRYYVICVDILVHISLRTLTPCLYLVVTGEEELSTCSKTYMHYTYRGECRHMHYTADIRSTLIQYVQYAVCKCLTIRYHSSSDPTSSLQARTYCMLHIR